MKKILGFDIETYKEHFVFVGSMYDRQERKVIKTIKVTDDNGMFVRDKMSEIEKLFDEADHIVSFNGKRFDLPILAKIRSDLTRLKAIPTKYIYQDAQAIISYDANNNPIVRRHHSVKEWNAKHFDLLNNCLLRYSLKQWEMYFNLRIRELPYAPDAALTDEMKKEIDDYCAYDVYAMMVIFWSSGYDGLGPGGKSGVLNTLPAQEVLLEWWPKNLPFTFDRTSQSIGAGVIYGTSQPIPPKSNQPLSLFNLNDFEVPIDIKMIIGYIAKSPNLEYDTTYNGIVYGRGGAHFIRPGHYRDLYAFDFASLYPTIISNWKLLKTKYANDKYAEITASRLVYKHKRKESIRYYNLDRGAKLILNAPSGAFRIRSGNSPMYDPAAGEAMAYIGQLIISELVFSLPKFEDLIEVNTDSVFVRGEENVNKCREMIKFFKDKHNLLLEEEYIEQIYIRDVNNYILYDKDGKVLKGKGIAYSDIKNKSSNIAVYNTLFDALIRDRVNMDILKGRPWNEYVVKYHKSAASKYAMIDGEPMKYKNYYFMWTTRECPDAVPISFSRDIIDRKNGAIKSRYGVWSQDFSDLAKYEQYIDHMQYRRDLDVELDLWNRSDLVETHLSKVQRKSIKSLNDLIVRDFI